jgi:hypothetical protein
MEKFGYTPDSKREMYTLTNLDPTKDTGFNWPNQISMDKIEQAWHLRKQNIKICEINALVKELIFTFGKK